MKSRLVLTKHGLQFKEALSFLFSFFFSLFYCLYPRETYLPYRLRWTTQEKWLRSHLWVWVSFSAQNLQIHISTGPYVCERCISCVRVCVLVIYGDKQLLKKTKRAETRKWENKGHCHASFSIQSPFPCPQEIKCSTFAACLDWSRSGWLIKSVSPWPSGPCLERFTIENHTFTQRGRTAVRLLCFPLRFRRLRGKTQGGIKVYPRSSAAGEFGRPRVHSEVALWVLSLSQEIKWNGACSASVHKSTLGACLFWPPSPSCSA